MMVLDTQAMEMVPLLMAVGYDLSGFVMQVGAEKQFDITDKWFFSVESRLTYATAEAEDELGGISDFRQQSISS